MSHSIGEAHSPITVCVPSCFSHVHLFVTLRTAACRAPPSYRSTKRHFFFKVLFKAPVLLLLQMREPRVTEIQSASLRTPWPLQDLPESLDDLGLRSVWFQRRRASHLKGPHSMPVSASLGVSLPESGVSGECGLLLSFWMTRSQSDLPSALSQSPREGSLLTRIFTRSVHEGPALCELSVLTTVRDTKLCPKTKASHHRSL